MKSSKLATVALTLLLSSTSALAQLSNQLSQSMVYQPMVNYASASSYDAFNAGVYYRNQWVGFSGAPSGAGFLVSFSNLLKNTSLGLSASTEKIGVHSNSLIQLNYAYKINLDTKSCLSFSLSPQIRFLSGEYSSIVSSNLGDPILFNDYQRNVVPNVKFGSYYFRNRFYLGLATTNLLHNKVQTTNVDTSFDPSQIGWFLHAGYQLKMNNENEIIFSALVKEHKGASLHGEFNVMWLPLDGKLGVGVSYRTSNDLVGIVNFELFEQWRISYAYQAALSRMSSYQDGTHEVIMVYEMPSKKQAGKHTVPRF